MSTVLVVDNADAAFLFALAFRLKRYKIWLFAAESVEQAQSLWEYIGAGLALLIINCKVRGVCPFAATMARRIPRLQILGVTSEGHTCGSCRKLFSGVLPDRRPRQDDDSQEWMEAIRGLVRQERAERKWLT